MIHSQIPRDLMKNVLGHNEMILIVFIIHTFYLRWSKEKYENKNN